MNERIEKLITQAWEEADKEVSEEDWHTYVHERIFQIKFARLIVLECVGCCEQVISDPVPKSVDTFLQGGIHCMDEIKQHFGAK